MSYTVIEFVTLAGDNKPTHYIYGVDTDNSMCKLYINSKYDSDISIPPEERLLKLDNKRFDGALDISCRHSFYIYDRLIDDREVVMAYNNSMCGAGMPLERSDNWDIVYGVSNPNLVYFDNGSRVVATGDYDPGDVTAYMHNGSRFANGTIECNVDDVNANASTDLTLLKFVDGSNMIGLRTSAGQFEVVECVAGVWTTIHTGSAETGHWMLRVVDGFAEAVINGNTVYSWNSQVSGEGVWGLLSSKNVDGHKLIGYDYISQGLNVQETPCMTSATTPYGEVTCSSHYGTPVFCWEAWNCSREGNTHNSWCTENGVMFPVWTQWRFDGAQPMNPIEITIGPRLGMNDAWFRDHNPEEIKVYLIQPGGAEVEVLHVDNLGWGNGSMRSWTISTQYSGIGVRVEIVRTPKSSSGDGTDITCIGYIRVRGTTPAKYYLVDDDGDHLVDDSDNHLYYTY